MNNYKIYTANSNANTVSVCNMEKVLKTIPVGTYPRCIALTPDESTAFVTNQKSHSVSVIDTVQDKVVHTINEIDNPTGVVAGHTVHGVRVHVAADIGTPGGVYVIDPSNYAYAAKIHVGNLPAWATMSIDGKFVYVTNFAPNSVSVIDTSTNMVVQTIGSCFQPLKTAASRSRQIYVLPNCMNVNFIWIVEVIDELKQMVVADVGVDGVILLAVAAHPYGYAVYVTAFSGGVGYINVIDTKQNLEVAGPLQVGTWPKGAVVSRDGVFCFVSDYTENKIAAIDVSNFSVFKEVKLGLGNGPFGIAVKTLP